MYIPKIIHQIWWQGLDKLPDKYKNYTNTWKRNHINWEFMYWDKIKIINLLKNHYPYLLKIFNQCPYMIQKIDLAKYIILYHFGGVYVDMDTICNKSLNNLFSNPNYKNVDFVTSKMEIIPFIKIINNAIIFSKPKHILLWFILNKIQKCSEKNFYQNQDLYIMESTGPIFFDQIISDFKHPNLLILPENFMESCTLLEYQKCKKIGKYITHHHTLSWSTSYFKIFFKTLTFLNTYKYFIIIIILISIKLKKYN